MDTCIRYAHCPQCPIVNTCNSMHLVLLALLCGYMYEEGTLPCGPLCPIVDTCMRKATCPSCPIVDKCLRKAPCPLCPIVDTCMRKATCPSCPIVDKCLRKAPCPLCPIVDTCMRFEAHCPSCYTRYMFEEGILSIMPYCGYMYV